MELPADPRNLVHGIYNKKGDNLLQQQPNQSDEWNYAMHVLSDTEDDAPQQLDDSPFEMIDYFY